MAKRTSRKTGGRGHSRRPQRLFVHSAFPPPRPEKPLKPDGDLCSESSTGSSRPARTARVPARSTTAGEGPRGVPVRGGPPGPVMRQVIGRDDRLPIVNPREAPFSAICSLDIRFRSGPPEIGTGWLVAPRLVVTAGHCVFNRRKGGFAADILVSPGRNGLSHWQSQTVSAQGGRFRTTNEHGSASSPNPDFDFGAIVLPRTFQDTGHFGMEVYSPSRLLSETFNIVGYPFDKATGTMWGHASRLSRVKERRLLYEIDSEAGQSGSPVYDRVDSDGSPTYVVVGIHNAALENQSLNVAARIEDQAFERIQRWIALSEQG